MKLAREALTIAVVLASSGFVPARAGEGTEFSARLRSLNEVPAVLSGASGRFAAELDRRAEMIHWTLSYTGLEGAVTQAHIHVGARHTNGGISVWLCANPPITAPANTPPCPPAPARLSGTIAAPQVVGPPAQGVEAGEFAALLSALKGRAAYVNVHTSMFPGGEVRGQVRADDRDRD